MQTKTIIRFITLMLTLCAFNHLFADTCPATATFRVEGGQVKAYDSEGKSWVSSEGDWSQVKLGDYIFTQAVLYDGGFRDINSMISCYYNSVSGKPQLRMDQDAANIFSQGSNWFVDRPEITHCPISSNADNHVELCPFTLTF